MTVLEMVERTLRTNGYDGLFNESGECACLVTDLEPCGNMSSECEAGFKIDMLGDGYGEEGITWRIMGQK